ncbi:allantoate amidohydrolase [Nocardioides sp. AE5]|uniref:allantoate amidohydrolase n=1 Tax=Nocardioides sp. AE5 TaxID=2962573 RepID=UPI002881BEFF|nr:allantoate amidohydrolase [Nocardioides sp. AE5]MDT0203499.1 allantoate amidohydrolase [Nocardioides sp. AE5]
MSFEQMWADLASVGRSRSSGGYFRPAFGSAERECHAWFLDQCATRGLETRTDGNGNTVAWWRPEGTGDQPGVLTGSHLDSVPDGGAYDGPLGVMSALAAIDRLRERGVAPSRPIGVAAFAEEEGSRFGLACLGSRLATGQLDPATARELRDRDGVPLPDAMAAAGLAPDLGDTSLLDGVGWFVELHVEQGRGLVDLAAPIGVASGIWPHGRYRFDFTGEANHAGTTVMDDRHDPMLSCAMTVLAANKQARLGGQRATFGRFEVTPNSTNAVPSRVTAWLDARCEDDATLAALVAEVSRLGRERAARDGTGLEVTAESVSPAVAFDPDLAARLAGDHAGPDWPVLATQAGHDAGILAGAGIPTAMLFVRNPTGISHAPAEHAEVADCLAGVDALADSLERLAG